MGTTGELHERAERPVAPATAAIVVTYRRPQLLLRVLDGIAQQSHPPHAVLVVDNAAQDEVRQAVAASHPRVRYVAAGGNLGPGGGFALGFDVAEDEVPADWYWLLDDDSPPAPNALADALRVAGDLGGPIGAIGMRGGHVRAGRIVHDLKLGVVRRPVRADFLLVDGSIVSSEAIRRVGRPRSDFFIMMEDLEFSLRIGEAGLPLYVRPDDGSTNLYQGSGAPWRGYYQCRNHLRMALDRGSVRWIIGWATRELAINFHHVRKRRWSSVALRARGAVDAIRNKMGRVVEP